MVHNPETTAIQSDNQPDKSSLVLAGMRRWLVRILIVAVIGGAGWYVYNNPQILDRFKSDPKEDKNFVQLQNQILVLQNELRGLQTENDNKPSFQDLAEVSEKIADNSKLNREVLESKASNAAILGLISRLDALELKVNNLGKVSSNGALILSAALLVKDSAATGLPFIYEAEVLRQLAAGTNMEPQAEIIARYAASGIVSADILIDDFNRLYAERQLVKSKAETLPSEASEPEKAVKPAGWKEKINSKLSELVIIEYHEEEAKEASSPQKQDEIYRLVNNHRLSAAAELMRDMPQYQSPSFQKWRQQVEAETEFHQALKRIQALTLAVMKAENLKNNAQ